MYLKKGLKITYTLLLISLWPWTVSWCQAGSGLWETPIQPKGRPKFTGRFHHHGTYPISQSNGAYQLVTSTRYTQGKVSARWGFCYRSGTVNFTFKQLFNNRITIPDFFPKIHYFFQVSKSLLGFPPKMHYFHPAKNRTLFHFFFLITVLQTEEKLTLPGIFATSTTNHVTHAISAATDAAGSDATLVCVVWWSWMLL